MVNSGVDGDTRTPNQRKILRKNAKRRQPIERIL